MGESKLSRTTLSCGSATAQLGQLLGVLVALLCCNGVCNRLQAEAPSQAVESPTSISANASELPAAAEVERWIKELSDDAYPVRLSAAEHLLNAGMAARDPLTNLVDSPDPEMRAASRRLVALIDRTEFQRRLSAFAADIDGRLGLTLPGWERFCERVGDDPTSRELFVEMQRHEAALLSSSFAATRHSLDDVWETRMNRIVQLQGGMLGSEPPSLGSCAAMVFLGAVAEMDVSDRGTILVESLIQQPPLREQMQSGQFREAIRRLVVSWIHNCPNRNEELLKRRLYLASINQLHEVVPWALSIASGKESSARLQPATRATAIQLIGQLGRAEHVDALESLLSDTTVCSTSGPGQPDASVQVCDVALVVMLHLSGERPADYGYMDARLHPQQMFQFQTFAIDDGEQRANAIAKWHAWRAQQKRDAQVIPADHREEVPAR